MWTHSTVTLESGGHRRVNTIVCLSNKEMTHNLGDMFIHSATEVFAIQTAELKPSIVPSALNIFLLKIKLLFYFCSYSSIIIRS